MKIIVTIPIDLKESDPEIYDDFRKSAISKSVINQQQNNRR